MLLDALDKKKRSFPLPADLVTFTEEIVNGKLHFLRSDALLQSMITLLFLHTR